MKLCYTVSAGESLEDALRQLYLIDAIDEHGQITDIGKSMAGKSSMDARTLKLLQGS